MAPLTFSSAYSNNFIAPWSHLANSIRTPVLAAVSGYALGGGCELALMCDIIYCTSTATFGQPEIKLGTIPGAGGSQRLTAAVGKSRAMDLILTGKNFSGKEAGEWGVAAKVIEGDDKEALLAATVETAATIAGYSRVAAVAAKEVVNKSQELSLREGVEYERRLFHGLFGSKDQKIGKCPLHFLSFLFFVMWLDQLTFGYRHDRICGEEEARVVEWVSVVKCTDTKIPSIYGKIKYTIEIYRKSIYPGKIRSIIKYQ